MSNESLREQVFKYVGEKYGSEIEHLWAKFPGYAVFRHEDNRKWYGLVMDVPRNRLGLEGEERTDIINVKLDDWLLRDTLIKQEGYFAGYHLNKGNWMSVLLDGTVPLEDICQWIDESYRATASKARQDRLRQPKEWLVPSNPKYYDIAHAFDAVYTLDWKQGRGIKAGDTVFIYAASPISAILYKCAVTETDIPCDYDDGKLSIKALMTLRLEKRYDPDRFTFRILKEEYGIYAVRGPRGVPYSLSAALDF